MTRQEQGKQLERMSQTLDSWYPGIRYIPLGWPPDGEVTQDDLPEVENDEDVRE